MKRVFDIVASAAALLVLSPVILLTAVMIRLKLGSPVLFRQTRPGLRGLPFTLYKFRTMLDVVDSHGQLLPDDKRLTLFGSLIRRLSLDELPQLINVLKGEMSIVGPRPHPVECKAADEYFWSIDPRYFDRHGIKPGMTGLAQVRGFRGATMERTDLTNRLKADLEYVDGWHIGRDLWIMVLTLGVLIHPNAF